MVAAAALVLVGNVDPKTLGVEEFFSLLHYQVPPGWLPEDCPLCQAGVPVNTFYGHGKEFLAAQSRALS